MVPINPIKTIKYIALTVGVDKYINKIKLIFVRLIHTNSIINQCSVKPLVSISACIRLASKGLSHKVHARRFAGQSRPPAIANQLA